METSRQILFAEDNDVFRDVVAHILERSGYGVTPVRTAFEALEVVQRGDQFDLVISDLGLPGRHDAELIREIRRHVTGVPIIYISGFPRHDAAARYDFPDDAEFLAKPFDVDELLGKVKMLLAD